MNSGLVRSIADLSSRWRNRFLLSKASSRPQHLRRGARGAKLACRFLRRNGYKILYHNFKGRSGGEIDVVCRDRDTLVFVEVKTRQRGFWPTHRGGRSSEAKTHLARRS
jgi:hypothetical protein